MDPLSFAASIITVLIALSSSTEAAKKLWGAPHGLQELASELSQLSALADTLAALMRSPTFRCIDLRTHEEAYTKLQDGQRIFEERLSKKHKTSGADSRFRRRTWILHRGRIRKLTRDVAVIRNDFISTMLLLNL